MAHDNAALSGELKAGLEQMTRAIAKASEKPTERTSEQNPRPKPSRQIVTGTIRPAVRALQVRALQASTKPANPPGLVNFLKKALPFLFLQRRPAKPSVPGTSTMMTVANGHPRLQLHATSK